VHLSFQSLAGTGLWVEAHAVVGRQVSLVVRVLRVGRRLLQPVVSRRWRTDGECVTAPVALQRLAAVS
jgi:hypothetical protein